MQYSGCVEVLGRNGDDTYRNHIKDTLINILANMSMRSKLRYSSRVRKEGV